MEKTLLKIFSFGIILMLISFIFLIFNQNEIFVNENISTEIVEREHFNRTELQLIEMGKKCFELQSNEPEIELFEDVIEAVRQPKAGRAIFFHVTTCAKTGHIELTAR